MKGSDMSDYEEVAIGIAKDRFVEAVHAKMAEGKTDEEAWEAFANMDDEEFESRLSDIISAIEDMLIQKRASYGTRNLSEFGDDGILVRTSDKFQRLIHMRKKGIDTTAVGEDRKDAWMDIAGYSVLFLVKEDIKEAKRA